MNMSHCKFWQKSAVILVVAAAGAIGPTLSAVQQRWYVNPNSGNDTNDGTTPATAWATVHKLNAALSNGTINNSWPWTQLDGSPVSTAIPDAALLSGVESGEIVFGAGATIYIDTAAGPLTMDEGIRVQSKQGVRIMGGTPGARADLRIFKVISPGSWTLVSGTTKVYESSDTEAEACLWESRKWLNHPWGADLAAVKSTLESTAGSFWTDGTKMYVHPFGDSVPSADGKNYERSRLLAGGLNGAALAFLGSSDCVASNLDIGGMTLVQPAGSSPGGASVSQSNYQIYCEANRQVVENCRAYYSNKHGISQIDGRNNSWCLIRDCVAEQGNPYVAAGGQTPFVAFSGGPSGLTTRFERCQGTATEGLIGSAAGAHGAGYHPVNYAHTVSTGSFAEISHTDCDYTGEELSGELPYVILRCKFNLLSGAAGGTGEGCLIDGMGTVVGATITNSIIRPTTYNSRQSVAGTIVYDGCTFDGTALAGRAFEGLIRLGSAYNVTIQNSVFIAPASGADVLFFATFGPVPAATGTRAIKLLNNAYRPGPTGRLLHYENNFTGNYYMTEADLAAAGLDANSAASNPLLSPGYRPQPGSSAIGRASGALTARDFSGSSFAARTTSGAYEFKPSFSQWQETRFSDLAQRADPAVGGAAADPDGNGLSNLLEYALGLAPTSSPADALAALPSPASGQPRVTMTYRAVQGAADLVYQPEASADLLTWQSGASVIETLGTTDLGNGANAVTVRALPPPAGSPVRSFLRLRVVQQ